MLHFGYDWANLVRVDEPQVLLTTENQGMQTGSGVQRKLSGLSIALSRDRTVTRPFQCCRAYIRHAGTAARSCHSS